MLSTRSVLGTTRLKRDEVARILGSILVVLGWFVIMNEYVLIGGAISVLGDCLAIPYFKRTKAWDVIIMIGLLHSVTLHKLAQYLFTSASF